MVGAFPGLLHGICSRLRSQRPRCGGRDSAHSSVRKRLLQRWPPLFPHAHVAQTQEHTAPFALELVVSVKPRHQPAQPHLRPLAQRKLASPMRAHVARMCSLDAKPFGNRPSFSSVTIAAYSAWKKLVVWPCNSQESWRPQPSCATGRPCCTALSASLGRRGLREF